MKWFVPSLSFLYVGNSMATGKYKRIKIGMKFKVRKSQFVLGLVSNARQVFISIAVAMDKVLTQSDDALYFCPSG